MNAISPIEQMINVNDDMGSALRSIGTLVHFTGRSWSGKKNDLEATEIVRENTGGVGRVGRYDKYLLGNHDAELKALQSAIASARNTHYGLTLPYGVSKDRLLANVKFIDYIKAMNNHIATVEDLKKQLVDVYPQRVRDAIRDQGSLGDPTDYPPPERIAEKFEIRFGFEPIPTDSGFAGLDKRIIEKLQSNMRERMREHVRDALQEGFEELYRYIDNIHDKLNTEKAIFRNTLLENAKRSVQIVRPFNLTADPEIEKLLDDIEHRLCEYDLDDLRKNVKVRKQAADEARSVLDKMKSYGF